MKVKGGAKRKVLNDAVEASDEYENQENSDYQSINATDEHRENQEEEKEKENEEEENNGEDNEEEDEEEEEEEEEDEEAPKDGSQEERPKLDEGFFEIEAIRRRRVRKGQLQYLIKWRGWPETSNTWEPLENLQSCSDVIDAFEESLRSGKSSRKRKRKGGGSNSLSKKQPLLSAYNVTGVVGQSLPNDPLFNTSLIDLPASTQSIGSGHEVENNGNVNNVKTAKHSNENRLANGSKQIDGRNKELDYDPKLSELKGMIATNEVNADKLALHFQEARVSDGNGLTHGLSKVDLVEPVHSDRRTGARRRKSGSVKRFKQDLASSKHVVSQNSTPSIVVGCDDTIEQLGMGNSNHKSEIEGSRNASTIVKILKPIDFSASVSDEVQDVVVTFMGVRSDGKEVMVDNKYLKANNPILLINFYEQHLKYSTQ